MHNQHPVNVRDTSDSESLVLTVKIFLYFNISKDYDGSWFTTGVVCVPDTLVPDTQPGHELAQIPPFPDEVRGVSRNRLPTPSHVSSLMFVRVGASP